MKNPIAILGTLAIGLALTTACDSPEKAQKTADLARQEADDKAAKTQRETDQARMQAEGNVEQKQAQANLILANEKNDCRAKIGSLLTDVDKKMSDIRAANTTARASARPKNEEHLANLAVKKELLDADLKQIEPATAGDWNAVKGKVDKDASDVRLMLVPLVGKT